MVRLERFELPTTWFEARYSIQLSYSRFARGREFYRIPVKYAAAKHAHYEIYGRVIRGGFGGGSGWYRAKVCKYMSAACGYWLLLRAPLKSEFEFQYEA